MMKDQNIPRPFCLSCLEKSALWPSSSPGLIEVSGSEAAPSVEEDRAMGAIGSDGINPSVLGELFTVTARPHLPTWTHHRSSRRLCTIAKMSTNYSLLQEGQEGKYCPVGFTSVDKKVMKQILLKATPTLRGE